MNTKSKYGNTEDKKFINLQSRFLKIRRTTKVPPEETLLTSSQVGIERTNQTTSCTETLNKTVHRCIEYRSPERTLSCHMLLILRCWIF